MEYLSGILAYTTATFPFKFHPLCSPLRLSHLMFADDLLLFCKGDVKSIMVILRSFSTFSHASGLQMNPTKTNAFFNGVPNDIKHEILQISGVHEGLLPFRYLGVPITCGRMSKMDCSILVEKLITHIRSFGSKKLSYSGRLVLVFSVLTAFYNYWMNIFVIPKGVLNKVNSFCRNYLWDGRPDFIRCPRVSWEKICSHKSEGGLGLRDSHIWNIAAMGKLVWWIYYNPDRLWVKCVNQIYLKGQNWDDYQPGTDISWGWKSVLDTKGYTIQSGYEILRQKFQTVTWDTQIWNTWCIPKHQFIAWLVAREALLLKERLLSLGIAVDADCLLCGKGIENHIHLFQTCEYARKIYDELGQLLNVALPATDLIMKLLKMRVSSRLQPNLVSRDVMWLSSVKLHL
ncbi:uncharacterized protein LOC141628905 [Silene latifolia]|uniref:uncharacterized protein LOC141628905 n=1 Tax=Silene latifolia TaxID=37657 RepID=UPI003D775CD3